MHRRERGFSFIVTSAIVLSIAAVSAAIDLTGTVRDASGAAIAKAEVILTTAGLTVLATTRSDASGHFRIKAPAPGS